MVVQTVENFKQLMTVEKENIRQWLSTQKVPMLIFVVVYPDGEYRWM